MNSPRSPSAPWLVPFLVGLCAAGAGLLAGWYLRGAGAKPGSAPALPEPRASDALTRAEFESAQRALLARLDALSRQPASSPGALPAGSDAQVIDLGRRIDDIYARIALLDTQTAHRDGSSLWTPPKGPGSGSIEAMCERMRSWYGGNTERNGDDIETQLRKEHDLGTFDDVVRAYGAPRRWKRLEQGWNLLYGCFTIEGWDLKQSLAFCLRDGYLAQVETEDCEP